MKTIINTCKNLKSQGVFKLALFIFSITISACGSKKVNENKNYQVIGSISTRNGNEEIRLYIIDSCEYIGYLGNWQADFISHKGNCRFCTARSNQNQEIPQKNYHVTKRYKK